MSFESQVAYYRTIIEESPDRTLADIKEVIWGSTGKKAPIYNAVVLLKLEAVQQTVPRAENAD